MPLKQSGQFSYRPCSHGRLFISHWGLEELWGGVHGFLVFHCSTATRISVATGDKMPESVLWIRHVLHLIITDLLAVLSLPMILASGMPPQNGHGKSSLISHFLPFFGLEGSRWPWWIVEVMHCSFEDVGAIRAISRPTNMIHRRFPPFVFGVSPIVCFSSFALFFHPTSVTSLKFHSFILPPSIYHLVDFWVRLSIMAASLL